MSDDEFSVRAIALELCESYEDPHELAEAVLARLGKSPRILRAALAEVLPQFLAAFTSRKRNTTISSRSRISNRSAKVAGIREWFPRFLSETLFTEQGWRRIGECTADDLLFAASQRRKRAISEGIRANQYTRLADALKNEGVDTVAELDETTVRAALDDAA
jgi:hypothetical protein